MALTKVIAIARGHDGTYVREVGEEFIVDLGDPRFKGSTWFTTKDKLPEPKVVGPNDQPVGAGPKRGSRSKAEPAADEIA